MNVEMIRATVIFLLVASALFHNAQAQQYHPSFRPDAMSDRPFGPPNEVLVLGTPHLSGLPNSFRPDMLEPVLTRLGTWHPSAIATENSSGLLCDAMRHQGKSQASSVDHYCPDPTLAGKAAGLTVVAANAEADRTLAAWPVMPTPAQRRRLALIFLAAGEPTSALVQWLRLPDAEQRADDGLTDELVTKLKVQATRKNESNLIGAKLAARLGLERVWSVDSQYFLDTPISEKAYAAALGKAWDNSATKARGIEETALYAQIGQPNGLLAVYRAFNAPSYAIQAYRSDWGAALKEPSPQGYGRHYVGYWETRNLRMVANIREVLTREPGTRMLAIVGASHKAYYEAYLDQMRDVNLINAEAVLR